MTVRAVILSQLEQVAREQNKSLVPLVDDVTLVDSGLDSLCLAILVARLEDALGIDPFSSGDVFHFPVTIGDFVAAYQGAGE